ncbi:MAG TPA: ABC transporter ATP-binding protein, partial [Solirubrobacterales bacterium]|jgi:ABC-type polysaccharide/polyol phosphate transport system ATPase subunit
MHADDEPTTTTHTATRPARPERIGPGAPLAIEARGLKKTFRIPTHRVDSLKERVVRPFAARDYRILRALDDVSFDVRQGEFFGIVGRNGSGKSTLLKCLASIYRADAGTIRMAGRLAPFIELGVGFNTELTARENVVLNGVMMGLTKRETKRRLDSILEFAELEEFIDLRLKNYSSGMLVRLAFSLMLQVDADVLLIDEVLAVGDAAFQQKCADAFHDMKAKGKTIVLVTHSMDTVATYCDRAMLVDDGSVKEIGDPTEVGEQYLRLNFERSPSAASAETTVETEEVRLREIWTESPSGGRGAPVEQGEGLVVGVELDILSDIAQGSIGFLLTNVDGVGITQFGKLLDDSPGPQIVPAGSRVTVRARMDSPLVAGRYFLHLGVSRGGQGAGTALYVHNAADFVVFGGRPQSGGMVAIENEIDVTIEPGGTA